MDPGMAHAHSSISRSLLQDCFDEVTARITDIAGRSTPFRVDESGLGRLRTISAPQQRRAAKAGYSFSGSRPGTLIRIWDHIWRSSDLMEVMHQALYTYQHKPLQKQEFTKIRYWIDCCTCWEHSDDLSKIYADVTERNPEWILPTLQRWNKSRNPWKRRQSVVALIEYASKCTRFLPFEVMISQVESLLDDEGYYVQKGVGWTIREIGHAYPDQIRRFMERHAARLSPQAWTGATKKLDRAQKEPLKALRNARKGVTTPGRTVTVGQT